MSSDVAGRASAHYWFDSLHAMPCGCVAGVYRALPGEMQVVAVEARGPHCVDQKHEIGSVLGLDVGDAARLS